MTGDAVDAVDAVLQTLRERGHRITMPRRAVIDALSRAEGHPTVEQITADIAERWPGIHLTTVYRTLETLAEVGVVTHVHLASGTAYHLADTAGAEWVWAAEQGVSYAFWQRNVTFDWIFREDARSFGLKLDLMRDYPGLHGISVWVLGSEDPGIWEVLAERR